MDTGTVRQGLSVTIYDVPVDDTVFFPVSGDMMRMMKREEEKEVAATRTHAKDKDAATTSQCQTTQKEDEMTTHNSTESKAEKTPSWAVPAKRKVFGEDVMHQGTTYNLERANSNGDEYKVTATVTQLEELGEGFTTDPYLSLDVDSAPFGVTHLNMDIAELETLADWLCGLVEKVQHLKPQH